MAVPSTSQENSEAAYQSLTARANAQRTGAERLADQFTRYFGSLVFLFLNMVGVGVWIFLNLGVLTGIEPFDPAPFFLLVTIVALETLFLSIIVLMSQNRAAHVATVRAEANLMLDKQGEEEVTKVLELLVLLAKKNGIDLSYDRSLQQMLRQTDADKIIEVISEEVEE